MADNHIDVEYRPAERRFVATVADSDGEAYIDVVPANKTWTLVHTQVPPSMAGGGVGSKLVKSALDHARSVGVGIIPRCPFVAAYIRRHPQELDLVPERYKYLVEEDE